MALNSTAGYAKNWFSGLTLLVVALTATQSEAWNSGTGQIAQHQARRLLTQRQSFKQSGTVVVDGKTYTTELKWFGPGSYDFVVSGVPSSFSGMAGAEGSWTLQRRPGNRCALQAGNRRAQCSAPLFWAMIELSAQPDAVGGSLVRAGLYAPQDTVIQETHSANVVDPEKRRAKPDLGKNGDVAKAVIRVRAPDGDEKSPDTPYIDFDQNFLAPLYAQFRHQGALHVIKARSELNIDREQPRNSHVLASSVNVLKGEKSLARFNRKNAEIDRSLKEDRYQEGVISLSSLQESLGDEANALLTGMLLTL